jgi:hypothetical protein
MKTRWLKWSLISCGVVLLLLLVEVSWLVMDFGGHNKIRLIRDSESPDGHLVAEVQEVITPMHGGADSVQVILRSTTSTIGDVVYAQTFECGPDYSAFQLEWRSPKNLLVQYGTCDSGRYDSAMNNKVLQKSLTWRDLSISYLQSDYVAHAKL